MILVIKVGDYVRIRKPDINWIDIKYGDIGVVSSCRNSRLTVTWITGILKGETLSYYYDWRFEVVPEDEVLVYMI